MDKIGSEFELNKQFSIEMLWFFYIHAFINQIINR